MSATPTRRFICAVQVVNSVTRKLLGGQPRPGVTLCTNVQVLPLLLEIAMVSTSLEACESHAATLTPDPLHSAFYDSHPPAAIRVARLQSLAPGAVAG